MEVELLQYAADRIRPPIAVVDVIECVVPSLH